MKVYFFPGLGFDKPVFRNLKLVGADIVYIDWIEPLVYMKRLRLMLQGLYLQLKRMGKGQF